MCGKRTKYFAPSVAAVDEIGELYLSRTKYVMDCNSFVLALPHRLVLVCCVTNVVCVSFVLVRGPGHVMRACIGHFPTVFF